MSRHLDSDEALLDEIERVVEKRGGAALELQLFFALDEIEATDLLMRFSVTMHEDGFLILTPQPSPAEDLDTFVIDTDRN